MTHTQPFLAPARTPSKAASSAELAVCLLGPSSAMSQLWAQMRRLAPHVRTALLTGEPDCGQEAVARVLLDLSPHAHRSFVQVTAAEAEARLLRSAGFTSLPNDVFLFLPNVDQFSPAAQDGLLRLMRTRRSRALTVIAASTEDLRALAGLGRFSSELADALASVRIAMPSLRHRREDLPMLISHMLMGCSQRAGVPLRQTTDEFLQAAMEHTWSGNLRELNQTLTILCASPDGQARSAAWPRIARSAPKRPARRVWSRSIRSSRNTSAPFCALVRATRSGHPKCWESAALPCTACWIQLPPLARPCPWQASDGTVIGWPYVLLRRDSNANGDGCFQSG